MAEEKQTHESATWIALISLFIAGGLIGVSTNLSKYAGDLNINPLAFLTWSVAGAGVLLTVLAVMRGTTAKLNKPSLEYFVVAGLISLAAPNLIFFAAVSKVGVSLIAIAFTLPPLLTYLGALILGLESFQWPRALGVIAALSGALIITLEKLSAPNANIFWIILTLIGPVFLAAGNIYRTVRWPAGETAESLAPNMMIAAALILICASLLPEFSLQFAVTDIKIGGLIGIQAVVFAVLYLALFILQKSGGPVLLSLIGAVGAVIGIPLAVWLLDEQIPERLFMGAAAISVGIFLLAVTMDETKKENENHD